MADNENPGVTGDDAVDDVEGHKTRVAFDDDEDDVDGHSWRVGGKQDAAPGLISGALSPDDKTQS